MIFRGKSRSRRRNRYVSTEAAEVLEQRQLLTAPTIESFEVIGSLDGATYEFSGQAKSSNGWDSGFVEIDLNADGTVDATATIDADGRFTHNIARANVAEFSAYRLRAWDGDQYGAWKGGTIYVPNSDDGNSGGSDDSIVPGVGVDLPPVILSITTLDLGSDCWLMTGHVKDESPTTVHMSFGDLYLSVNVGEDGRFSAILQDQPIPGLRYTAVATDDSGQESNPFDFIFA